MAISRSLVAVIALSLVAAACSSGSADTTLLTGDGPSVTGTSTPEPASTTSLSISPSTSTSSTTPAVTTSSSSISTSSSTSTSTTTSSTTLATTTSSSTTSTSTSTTTSTTVGGGTHRVSVGDEDECPDGELCVGFFVPLIITIGVGDTVVWTNDSDSIAHTATSGTGGFFPGTPDDMFDSDFLGLGESFAYTFNEVGSFPVFCTIHPILMGTATIVVEG